MPRGLAAVGVWPPIDSEKFENPMKVDCAGLRVGCYDKLEDDGSLSIGTEVKAGDVIIGKTITTTEIGEGARRSIKRDRSIMIKHSEEAIVDAVMLCCLPGFCSHPEMRGSRRACTHRLAERRHRRRGEPVRRHVAEERQSQAVCLDQHMTWPQMRSS